MGPLRSLKTSFLVNKIPDYVFNIKAFLTYHFLIDIDECQNVVHSCGNNSDCVNIEGSYSCTCPAGYQWNEETCQGVASSLSYTY